MARDPLTETPPRPSDGRPSDGHQATLTRDRVANGRVPVETVEETYPRSMTSTTIVDANEPVARNRVQAGPIIAGAITGLVTLLVLAVLGLAVGASAFEPGTDRGDWGAAAGIWGGISALIAFFLGGWVAAKTAAVRGEFAGLMNGLMAGMAILLVMLWLTTTGVTNLLGFVGNNVADIAAVASDTIQADTADVEGAIAEAESEATSTSNQQAAFDAVESGAWGTFAVLILALAAAAIGGMLGHNDRRDLRETAI